MPSRILIVDDHSSFRRTARLVLEERGYIVAGEAANSDEAVEALERVAPDGVMLDVHLDGVMLDVQLGAESGFMGVRDAHPDAPGLSVVLVSASDYGEFSDLMEASGARGFMLKARLGTAALSRFWPCYRPTR